jgi:hypothetical protein
VKAAEIETQKDLQAWLEGQNQEVCVWIAARAAARKLPLYWSETPLAAGKREESRTLLTLYRSLLTALALANATNKIIQGQLRSAATHVVTEASAAAKVLAGALGTASVEALFVANAAADAEAAPGSAGAVAKTRSFVDAQWSEVNGIATPRALWDGGMAGMPPEIAKAWDTTRAALTARIEAGDTGWQFWLDWYEAQLTGADQNWEMLKEIVLIPHADWQQGAAHVNGLIEEIVGRYRVEDVIADNPYAHRIEFDPARNRLVSLPVDTPDLAGIIDAVGQALADFEDRCARLDANSNIGTAMQSALDLPVADLHRDLKRHHNDAAMLFEKLEAARREIDMIAGQEAFANEGSFKRLTNDLERRAEDILAAAPAVLEMERNRVAVQVARYTEEQRLMALRLCAGMHNDSDGGLQAAAALAARGRDAECLVFPQGSQHPRGQGDERGRGGAVLAPGGQELS